MLYPRAIPPDCSLYILDISPLMGVQFANAFSKSVACLFILSHSKTNLFIWLPWILVAELQIFQGSQTLVVAQGLWNAYTQLLGLAGLVAS